MPVAAGQLRWLAEWSPGRNWKNESSRQRLQNLGTQQTSVRANVDIGVDSRTRGSSQWAHWGHPRIRNRSLLKMEVPIGEFLELQLRLRFQPVRVYATVRQRNTFGYGFRFVESHAMQEIIPATCRPCWGRIPRGEMPGVRYFSSASFCVASCPASLLGLSFLICS